MFTMKIKPTVWVAAIFAWVALAFYTPSTAADKPSTITVDWAYYNPVSILLKQKGWLEEDLAAEEIKVRWVLSLGTDKALVFLRGGSVDFGSTAEAASVIGRAGGLPIKGFYVYSKPEWTALVTRCGSGIKRIADLKCKRVALTRGTDPHIFLLRAVGSVGLSERDITTVLLQHPDGYNALIKDQVDTWAGLDPHMAKGQLADDTELFFRNPYLNTYGILNAQEAFVSRNPKLVERVLLLYELARRYALTHPAELEAALVKVARFEPKVAALQLRERTDFSNPTIGKANRQTFLAAGDILQKVGIIKADVDIVQTVDDLIDIRLINAVRSF